MHLGDEFIFGPTVVFQYGCRPNWTLIPATLNKFWTVI